MSHEKAWTALGLIGRVALGAAFITSGWSKAVAPAVEFAVVIETYQIVPVAMALTIAKVLPWFELFLGTFVLLGYYRRPSVAGLGFMLAAFIWALITAQLRGIDLGTCGCFGRTVQLLPWQATLLDFMLAALAYAVWRDRNGPYSLDRWIEGPAPEPAPAGKKHKHR